MRALLASLLLGCSPELTLSASADSGEWPDRPSDDDAILSVMSRREVAALSACVLERGETVWCQGYGWADIAEGIPATPSTLYDLASVSKLLTTAGVLSAAAAGTVDLDAPLSLGFPVSWPDGAPTLRHLLTHTSGLGGDDIALMLSHSSAGRTPSLPRYIEPALSDAGIFSGRAPGERWSYSNTGMSAAALAVEHAAGVDFSAHLEATVLAPLGLSVTPTPQGAVALRYPDTRSWAPAPVERSDLYPSGWLYGDAVSLARFLAALWSGAVDFDPSVMLEPGTDADNFGLLPIRAQGLGAGQYRPLGGRSMWGHMGNDRGAHTLVLLDPATGDGIVILATGIGESGVMGWLTLKKVAEILLPPP